MSWSGRSEPARALFGGERFAACGRSTWTASGGVWIRSRWRSIRPGKAARRRCPPARRPAARAASRRRRGELRADAEQLGVDSSARRKTAWTCGTVSSRDGGPAGTGCPRASLLAGFRPAARRPPARRPGGRPHADRRRIRAEFAELWRRWLRLWPSRWEPEQRKLLGEYVSLLQMIVSGDRYDEGAGRSVFRRYYSLFPKVTRLLPCWAVTSLSARGRLPFEPAFFDLVVIDEASQCDIASALPLLFRAQARRDHRRPSATEARQHGRAAGGPADSRGSRPRGRPRGLGLFGEFAVRPGAQPVPPRGHRESARPPPLAPRHHRVFEPPFLPRRRCASRPITNRSSGRSAQGPAVRWLDVRGKVVRPARGGAVNAVEAEAVVARSAQAGGGARDTTARSAW